MSAFTDRTTLPSLGSDRVVVDQTPTKDPLDVVRLLAPVLNSAYPCKNPTSVEDDEDDIETEDLADYSFTAMQQCPSLTASQDSLTPATTPSPSKAAFFGSDAVADAALEVDSVKSTHGTVLVVGVGFVGAHLMECFSSAYEVVAFDVSENRCQYLRKLHCNNPNVTFISDLEADDRTKAFDLCLISVPTLLTSDLSQPGSTVVVESSITVGMTRELFSPLLTKGVHVDFSPERVDPGRTLPAFQDIPKVVSGLDTPSLHRITELYSRVFSKVVPVSKPEIAEFTKLYENCQRLINIAYVNEIADACAKHGVEVHEVVMASATKPFGFMPYTPSLGAGGHCIPVNPFYLFANCDLPLLRTAALANQRHPVEKAVEVAEIATQNHTALGKQGKPKIAVVGMGFKRGEASLAYAPTVTLADKLTELGVEVSYVDEYVTSEKWGKVDMEDFRNAQQFDGMFDAVVVAQKPIASELAILEQLKLAKVVYFTK
ncbi:related to UDP-glucose 6-dehydrogenase [Ustilago bromivora]|uniref:Related to UDP-glucose 6-dehydrogenase n=1 Tax=Ustilago bromivora TaxID=307758 RepID=A0A1K0HCW0_9BASI|nr:related to UDP-glucose 6-dehydrogenase [Ustilago bromivora]SYW80119.1 related to UDP-glucose 6-dehydrogenase [Ustilago bromivora]